MDVHSQSRQCFCCDIRFVVLINCDAIHSRRIHIYCMLLIRKQNENHITAFIDIGLRSVMCYVRTVSVNTKCSDTYLPRSYEYEEIFSSMFHWKTEWKTLRVHPSNHLRWLCTCYSSLFTKSTAVQLTVNRDKQWQLSSAMSPTDTRILAH